jgi:hypothetical protein
VPDGRRRVRSLRVVRTAIGSTSPRAGEPVFATIEAAVRDAFEVAEDQAGPGDRERLRIGTIRRVEGGFAWTDPVRSQGTVGASAPLQARLRLGPDDVAVYSLHPRSGDRELDRLNEAVGAGERRLVDVQDRLHRPDLRADALAPDRAVSGGAGVPRGRSRD